MTKKDESIMNMLVSEDVLKKEWDNELDERWDDIEDKDMMNQIIASEKNFKKGKIKEFKY
jgi:hypothetical protein